MFICHFLWTSVLSDENWVNQIFANSAGAFDETLARVLVVNFFKLANYVIVIGVWLLLGWSFVLIWHAHVSLRALSSLHWPFRHGLLCREVLILIDRILIVYLLLWLKLLLLDLIGLWIFILLLNEILLLLIELTINVFHQHLRLLLVNKARKKFLLKLSIVLHCFLRYYLHIQEVVHQSNFILALTQGAFLVVQGLHIDTWQVAEEVTYAR